MLAACQTTMMAYSTVKITSNSLWEMKWCDGQQNPRCWQQSWPFVRRYSFVGLINSGLLLNMKKGARPRLLTPMAAYWGCMDSSLTWKVRDVCIKTVRSMCTVERIGSSSSSKSLSCKTCPLHTRHSSQGLNLPFRTWGQEEKDA